MNPDIGYGIQPADGGRIGDTETGYFKSGQKVFFDIADPIFNPALFIAFPDTAGGDAKAVVIGKIQIFGIQKRFLTQDAFQDTGF